MANTVEYIFSLQDKVSAKIGNITITSDRMLGKFADLEKKTLSVNKTFNETGRTMGSLREKVAALQAEREWIPASNIEGIRAYNREMKKLNKEIVKLESLNGGKFKKWGKEAFAAMPGNELISNPLVAGAAAVGFSAKNAMNFDEGMAKVNITAQLDESQFPALKQQLKKIAKDNKTDIVLSPVGFEKINSQLNDVDLSLSILDASLKGSKGGFTDLDTVSGALAQTLSIVGKENTNAMEVLDTFFAAKRVGAGEFADFARYMPNLIAGANNLGINFKEVAGTFAYMTGKGQSAERAAVLMENAFSVLGRADVRGKMEKAGIKVFDDTGKIRSVVDIFRDLQKVTSSMNDEQKSSLLEKLGLVDKEAKNAFSVLTSDIDKLNDSMNEVANSSGETDKALGFSENTIQKSTEVWNQFKNIGTELGELTLPVISVALDTAGIILSGLGLILEGVSSLSAWWIDKLNDGNPIIWGLTAAIAALSAALLINCVRTNSVWLLTKAKVVWDGIQTGVTWALTTAQNALNAAFIASPLGWIALAIGAVVGAVVLCWQKFEGFRRVVYGVWSMVKAFGKSLFDSIVTPFKQVLSGIGSVCSALVNLVKGNFKEAAEEAKTGFKDIGVGIVKSTPVAVVVNAAQNTDFSGAWEKGKQAGSKSWQDSQDKAKEADINSLIPQTAPATGNDTGKEVDYDALMKKLAKQKGSKKTKSVLKLDDKVQNYGESSDYIAITKKLAPVKFDFKPNIQAEAVTKPAAKIIDARPLFAQNADKAGTNKVNERTQEYAPEKVDYLKDIMTNVRKIAAVAAIPLAINLGMPEKAGATPVLPTNNIQVETPAVNLPGIQTAQPDIPEAAPSVINVSNPMATVVPSPTVNMPPVNIPSAIPPVVNVSTPPNEMFAPLPAINVPPVEMPIPETPAVSVSTPENLYATMPDIKLPDTDAHVVERNERITENKETTRTVETGRIIRVERVCDNVVINVANTDQKGTGEIRSEIIRVLDELSMYEV